MAKNHMAEVAKMLGVEPGEELKISGKPENDRFFIGDEGLTLLCGGTYYAYKLFTQLLTGEKEIVRRPWRPKKGERYWFVDICSDGSCLIDNCSYSGASFDINCILMGNCFPTREAAEAAAPEIVKFYADVRKMVEEE